MAFLGDRNGRFLRHSDLLAETGEFSDGRARKRSGDCLAVCCVRSSGDLVPSQCGSRVIFAFVLEKRAAKAIDVFRT